ncbi:MAG: Hsp20/alpha crystallin family protein [Verrucomicrobiota bacterium]
MKLIRYNYPTRALNPWDSLFADPFRAFSALTQANWPTSAARGFAGVEWYESDDAFHAVLELPGIPKKDLEIEVEGGVVRLVGAWEGKSLEQERRVEQIVRIPEGVNPARISAKLEDGLLELSFPKEAKAKAVRVEID